jgi:peroxiredoxin Q/BCP
MIIQAGQKAPDFSLPDETGKEHRLSDYMGKPGGFVFYPEDDTSDVQQKPAIFVMITVNTMTQEWSYWGSVLMMLKVI